MPHAFIPCPPIRGKATGPRAAVAPAWHTVVVLILAMGFSFWGSRIGDLSANGRLWVYLIVMLVEWAFLALVWWGLRLRGVPMSNLIGGSWPRPAFFFRDLGFGVVFILIASAVSAGLGYLLKANMPSLVGAMMPHTLGDALAWVVLSCTAGFCEEIIFRGYFGRQFTALTRSAAAGIILQGIVFGLGHGYQGWKLVLSLSIYGSLLGVLAHWRRSLRPGILAHALQDSASGVLWYLLN